MDISEMYAKKQYPDILDHYLEKALSQSYKREKEDINQRIDILVKTTYSCYQCGAYKELLELLQIIKKISFISWNGHQAEFLFFEFEALLYYLFNQNEFAGETTTLEKRIEDIIPQMVAAFSKEKIEVCERTLNKIKVFNDYKKEIYPYHIVSFLYPYAPPFGEGELDLTGCDPFISLKTEEKVRDHDSFTQFTFKIKGYTNADLFWRGHSWKAQERLPAVKKTLPLLNLVLLRALCAMPNTFVPLYNIEQISSAAVSTYTNDGTPIHVTILGSLFDAHWTGGNIPNRKFSPQEIAELSEDIKRHYQCNNFFIQFHQAKNSMNAGLYVESFILFSIAAESMFYYWCGEVAKGAGKYEEYKAFSDTKTSSCDKCPLLMKSGKTEKRAPELFPGTRDYFDFLNTVCGISKDDCKKLNSVYHKAHKTELRNDIVHGRTNSVTLQDLRVVETNILEMQSLFIEIEEKNAQRQTSDK